MLPHSFSPISRRRCTRAGSPTTPPSSAPLRDAVRAYCSRKAGKRTHPRRTAIPKAKRNRDAKPCADAECPHKARADCLSALVEAHKAEVEELNRVIRQRDTALADLSAEYHRRRDATDVRYLYVNTLNDAHDLHHLHVIDIKHRNSIAAEKNALVAKELGDRCERYRTEREE